MGERQPRDLTEQDAHISLRATVVEVSEYYTGAKRFSLKYEVLRHFLAKEYWESALNNEEDSALFPARLAKVNQTITSNKARNPAYNDIATNAESHVEKLRKAFKSVGYPQESTFNALRNIKEEIDSSSIKI